MTTDGLIYAEELYGDEDWLAQHQLSIADGILKTVDESWGESSEISLLPLPEPLIKSHQVVDMPALTYHGARLKGICAEERIEEVVLPLDVSTKIDLVDFMEWDIQPMQLIGIAETAVLASAPSHLENVYWVCRRLRLAYRLLPDQIDAKYSYDYDSLELYLFHPYDVTQAEAPDLLECLDTIDDVMLLRPMDCLYHNGQLIVADGGEGEDASAIHIFELLPEYDEDSP